MGANRENAEPRPCPYCGVPMRHGYLRTQDNLIWSDRDLEVNINRPRAFNFFFKTEAWHCPGCKKMIFDTQ